MNFEEQYYPKILSQTQLAHIALKLPDTAQYNNRDKFVIQVPEKRYPVGAAIPNEQKYIEYMFELKIFTDIHCNRVKAWVFNGDIVVVK